MASAQERQRATTAAALLKEPGGLRLGSLVAGVDYPVGRSDRTWITATIDGWIPASSAQSSARDGFDLTVIAGGGESVRAVPGGAIIARVQEGTLLSRVTVRGKWIHVRRQGWVARTSLGGTAPLPTTTVAAKPAPKPPPQAAKPVAAVPAPAPTSPPTAAPAPSTSPPPAPATTVAPQAVSGRADSSGKDAPQPGEVSGRVALRRGAPISVAPDGEPVATLGRAGTAAVLERSRDWTRVQVEGWVRNTDITGTALNGPRITAAMIRAAPDRYLGQPVSWRLQFLAIQEADELRPELPRGQPYLLTRGPLPESGFVYVTASKAEIEAFRQRQPLDEITIEGVLKAARTRYLPTPVVELKSTLGGAR
jgi:hypothetical protein